MLDTRAVLAAVRLLFRHSPALRSQHGWLEKEGGRKGGYLFKRRFFVLVGSTIEEVRDSSAAWLELCCAPCCIAFTSPVALFRADARSISGVLRVGHGASCPPQRAQTCAHVLIPRVLIPPYAQGVHGWAVFCMRDTLKPRAWLLYSIGSDGQGGNPPVARKLHRVPPQGDALPLINEQRASYKERG